MTSCDPKLGQGRRRARARVLLLLAAVLVVGGLTIVPASAGLELPPLPPLPLPTLTPLDQPVSTTVDGLLDVPDQILGNTGDKPVSGGTAPKTTNTLNSIPAVDAWSIDRLPALRGTAVRTEVSSSRLDHPGSYSSLVSGGLKRAAGRAADLAAPLAAPLALALFAVGLLAIAARGPGRLVKVEEERQIYRERRTYRL
jgi:hypothetical protein